MKKSKILMPILGVGAVAATVAPMVAMTSCNKEEIISVVNVKTDDSTIFYFTLKYAKYIKSNSYSAEELKWDDPDEKIDYCEFGGFPEKNTGVGTVNFKNPLKDGKSIKVKITFKLIRKDPQKDMGEFTVVLNCVGK